MNQRVFLCAMHAPTTGQWWSKRAMQCPHTAQWLALGGRHTRQVLQWRTVQHAALNSGALPSASTGPSGSSG